MNFGFVKRCIQLILVGQNKLARYPQSGIFWWWFSIPSISPVGENSRSYLNIICLMASSSFQCQQVYFYDGSWILLVAVSCWSQITPWGIANKAGSTAGAWGESHSTTSHWWPVQLAHWSSLRHVSSPYHPLLQQFEFQKDGYDNIFILGTCSVRLKTSLIC